MNNRIRRRFRQRPTAATPEPAKPAADAPSQSASAGAAAATLSLNEEAAELGTQVEQLAERISSLETFIVTSPREATLQRLRTLDIVPPDNQDDDGRRAGSISLPSSPFTWNNNHQSGGARRDDTGRLTSSQRRRLRYTYLRHLVMFVLIFGVCALLLIWVGHYFQ